MSEIMQKHRNVAELLYNISYDHIGASQDIIEPFSKVLADNFKEFELQEATNLITKLKPIISALSGKEGWEHLEPLDDRMRIFLEGRK